MTENNKEVLGTDIGLAVLEALNDKFPIWHRWEIKEAKGVKVKRDLDTDKVLAHKRV